jgi:hypothetical protein
MSSKRKFSERGREGEREREREREGEKEKEREKERKRKRERKRERKNEKTTRHFCLQIFIFWRIAIPLEMTLPSTSRTK